MEKLAATGAQQQQLEPVSAHVDKLNAQLADNKAILDDLDRNVANIAALKTAADGLTRDAAPDDESSKGASNTVNVSVSVNCDCSDCSLEFRCGIVIAVSVHTVTTTAECCLWGGLPSQVLSSRQRIGNFLVRNCFNGNLCWKVKGLILLSL